MDTRWIGHPFFHMEEVDSTNEEAKRYASQGVESGALIVAEKQTAGKGRRGRSWSNTPGECLQMSLLLRPSLTPNETAGLTLVAALAVCRAVESVLPSLRPQIKWPNDVIVGTKKICGILVELLLDAGQNIVVIGIGVNVNNMCFPGELREKATSLRLETGRPVERELLMERIWQDFETLYERYQLTNNMRGLKPDYEQRLVNIGRPVCVRYAAESLEGIAEGIDTEGRLLLRGNDGIQRRIDAGEVSVRGIYGYV
ncbi:MAG: biotin--[acetyl-CoA-carboxylase] ligase [Lachnospiraceae bacterium]|nr:biotin--[acetyl-CoA-carboxylase] ligase [Lachnospiraceae bacterium]